MHAQVPSDRLYRRNGLQFLPFNTLYQLAAERRLADAGRGVPSACCWCPTCSAYWLTGRQVAEHTNASTTGLLDARSRQWDDALIARARPSPRDLPRRSSSPARPSARCVREVADRTGSRDRSSGASPSARTTPRPPSSPSRCDPARASPTSPAARGRLVGRRAATQPVLTDAARAANFTNEGGVDGTIRFLHNVMGLWLLSESLRVWRARGGGRPRRRCWPRRPRCPRPPHRGRPRRPAVPAARRHGRPDRRVAAPSAAGASRARDRAAIVRCILESLAERSRTRYGMAAELSGRARRTDPHRRRRLPERAAVPAHRRPRRGLPVVAGPVEATALGNVLVQARTHGRVGSLEDIRQVIARSFEPFRYTPRRRGARPIKEGCRPTKGSAFDRSRRTMNVP